jgi:quinol monooxygenase YgiN
MRRAERAIRGVPGRQREGSMAVMVIVELKARPGRRDELRSRIEQLAARDRPSDYHGSRYFESVDDPDLLIDIAEWESPEARATHMEQAMAAGAYGPVLELVAGPFRATVIRPLP